MIPKSELERIADVVEARKYNQCPYYAFFRKDDSYLTLNFGIRYDRRTFVDDWYRGGKFCREGDRHEEWNLNKCTNFYEILAYCDSIEETFNLCRAFNLMEDDDTIENYSFPNGTPLETHIWGCRTLAERRKHEREDEIFSRCGSLLPAMSKWMKKCYSAFSTLFDIVDYGNLKKYASLCKGTLKDPDRYKSIIEAKTITDKILNYAPQLAEFSEQFEEVRKMVSSIPYYMRTFDYDRMRGGTLRESFEKNISRNFEHNENADSKS